MKNAGPCARTLALLLAAAPLLLGLTAPAAAAAPDKTKGFFPVSVWYAGGKARAPMLETVTPQSREIWKKDIDQIKRLGFNTVRVASDPVECIGYAGDLLKVVAYRVPPYARVTCLKLKPVQNLAVACFINGSFERLPLIHVILRL